jgi:DNA mismatch endonuclease, patch repair protein
MAAIRSKNTKPEVQVRSFLHKEGFRFRLHDRTLAGSPDIVLKKYRTIVFVNGCFWHRHEGCRFAYNPKSREQFWQKKFKGNVERDIRNYRLLSEQGWNVISVWECEVKDQTFTNWLPGRICSDV